MKDWFSFPAYNEKVVLFLRQPNVEELLRERSSEFCSNSGLKDKIAKISTRGVEMLERLSNDIELTCLLRFVAMMYCLFLI